MGKGENRRQAELGNICGYQQESLKSAQKYLLILPTWWRRTVFHYYFAIKQSFISPRCSFFLLSLFCSWYELWFFKTHQIICKISSFLSVDFSQNEQPQYSLGQTEHTWNQKCSWLPFGTPSAGGEENGVDGGNPKQLSHVQRLQIRQVIWEVGQETRSCLTLQ